MRDTLTKENFWNETYAKFPKATKLFCDWIDEYKKAVNWNILFNGNIRAHDFIKTPTPKFTVAPKFHDLPYAIQQGIWIAFVEDTLHRYFEQPEYIVDLDLEEDILEVLGELEKVLD